MTDHTISTPPVASTDEPVKGSRPPMPPMPPENELRLFGGGGTAHYRQFGLQPSSEEAALTASIERFHARCRALLAAHPELSPLDGVIPLEVP